jgi:hypothetical protein
LELLDLNFLTAEDGLKKLRHIFWQGRAYEGLSMFQDVFVGL